jgi:ElaB/YqjD/DUF883 family membrane-anchored ribosome-binding protein
MNNQNVQKSLSEKVEKEENNIKDKFKEGLKEVRDNDLVKNAEEQATKYATEAKKAVGGYVQDNPIAALTLAALAGIGLALLLTR